MTRARFDAASRFDEMVATATKYADLWTLTRGRASVDDAAVAAVEALGVPLHLVVLSEDWCIDSLGSLPYLDRSEEHTSELQSH